LFGTLAFVSLLLFLFSACARGEIEVRDDDPKPIGIAVGETLSFVSLSTTLPEGALKCLENSVKSQAPDLTVIPSQEFRDSLFPWFEPGTIPNNDEDLAELMDKPKVQKKVREFRLRYLVALQGRSRGEGLDQWGGCVGGYAMVGCVGGMSVDSQTDLTASIIDLQSSRTLVEIEASGSASTSAGLILIVPYLVVGDSLTDTCRALAGHVVETVR
jgi:hypothetical protein